MTAPIGDLLDSLGIRAELGEGELVTHAVVLLKVVQVDGGVGVRTLWADGTTWYDRRALLEIARGVEVADTGTSR